MIAFLELICGIHISFQIFQDNHQAVISITVQENLICNKMRYYHQVVIYFLVATLGKAPL